MQHVFLSKINVKKRKIIHFCEIASTACFRILTIESFHGRNFGFCTGNFGFHRRNLNFRTGNFFRKISFKYNGLYFLNTIIYLITLTGSMPDKWHLLFYEWRWRISWTKMRSVKIFLNCSVQERFTKKFISAL